MKKSLTTLLAILLLSTLVHAQSINGPWTGELNAGITKLKLVFNFTQDKQGKNVCTLDVPQQSAKGIPATLSLFTQDSIKITIPLIGASYTGHIAEGEIIGKFTQSGFTFDLHLKPGTVELKRPQLPQPPFEYSTEEVCFTNSKENATLCGTLTYPVGYDKMKKETVPVVLMVSGSGLQNRDEELFGHKPFLVIADYLAKHGIASLRYDDRSVGKSTGDAQNATTYNNMNDAICGLEYLKQTKKFGKVGLLGHSEGGCIAFMSAARKKTDFIVSLAGSGVRGDSILVEQNRIALKQRGLSQNLCNDYCKALKEVYAYKIANKEVGNAEEIVNSILGDTKANIPAEAQKNLVDVLKLPSPWLDYFIGYDPTPNISKAECPVMAINGSLDTQVISASNLGAIKKLLPANKQNLIKEYPGLNHLFQHCQTGSVMEYANIEETISPEVLQDIATWINKLK